MFLLLVILNYILSYVLERLFVIILFIFLFCIILLGIIFDIIGIVIIAVDEVFFYVMAVKKVKGVKVSVWFIKNVSKVFFICNDVIGDICGILSGVFFVSIVFYIVKNSKVNFIFFLIFLIVMVAVIIIFGKLIGKYFVIKKSNEIVKISGKIFGIFLKM